MKKTYVLGLSLFMLFSCTSIPSNSENDDKQATSNVVMQEIISTDFSYDRSNFDVLMENNDVIAIITIDEIDGVSNKNQVTQEYVSVYTYGKATVNEIYKGELASDEKISFVRLGGEILFNEWVKGISSRDYERLTEKHDNTNNKLVNSNTSGNIAIEAGKTYLVSMSHNDAIHNINEYSINAMEYGLRETKQSEQRIKETLVKNNITGEWEPLNNLLIGN